MRLRRWHGLAPAAAAVLVVGCAAPPPAVAPEPIPEVAASRPHVVTQVSAAPAEVLGDILVYVPDLSRTVPMPVVTGDTTFGARMPVYRGPVQGLTRVYLRGPVSDSVRIAPEGKKQSPRE